MVPLPSSVRGKCMLHPPAASTVQPTRAVRSAARGARKAAVAVKGRTNDFVETAAESETRIREIGKR